MTGYTTAVAQQVEELKAQFAGQDGNRRARRCWGRLRGDRPDRPRACLSAARVLAWLSDHLPLSDADIYPVFLDPNLVRVDGKPHTPPITPAKWRGQDALQYSSRSAQRDPEIDTAAIKAAG